MSKRIFVSYAREDRSLVEHLATDLRRTGFEPFFDEDLDGGVDWWDALMSKVETCDVFLPALSARFVRSAPCGFEVDHAVALGKPLLPVELEPHVPPALCASAVAKAQWLTYNPTDKNTTFSIIAALNKLPAAPPIPDPVPPRPEVPISYLKPIMVKIRQAPALTWEEQNLVWAELKGRFDGDEHDDVVALSEEFLRRPETGVQISAEIQQRLDSDRRAVEEKQAQERQKAEQERLERDQAEQQRQDDQRRLEESRRREQEAQRVPVDPPPPPNPPQAAGQKPPNFMVWAIIGLVLSFCTLFGLITAIPAVIFSSQVDSKWTGGDAAGATDASAKAKLWTIITFVIIGVSYFFGFVLLAAASSSSSGSSGF